MGDNAYINPSRLKGLQRTPLIYVAGIFSSKLEDKKAVATHVRDASIRILYFQNYGILKVMKDGMFDFGKKLFDFDFEEKMIN